MKRLYRVSPLTRAVKFFFSNKNSNRFGAVFGKKFTLCSSFHNMYTLDVW